jgi:hypothetical protein
MIFGYFHYPNTHTRESHLNAITIISSIVIRESEKYAKAHFLIAFKAVLIERSDASSLWSRDILWPPYKDAFVRCS